MSFRLVPKSVTLNGVVALILQWLCHRIRVRCRRTTITSASKSFDTL